MPTSINGRPLPQAEWLVHLLQPPWTNNRWDWIKHRAQELADESAEHAHLPALVAAERERIKQAALAIATPTSSPEYGTQGES